MDPSETPTEVWSRQDRISLLQLIIMVVIPLINLIWHLVTGYSKWLFERAVRAANSFDSEKYANGNPRPDA